MQSDFQHNMQQSQPDQSDLVAFREEIVKHIDVMTESVFTELKRSIDQGFIDIREDIGLHRQMQWGNGIIHTVRRFFNFVSLARGLQVLLCCSGDFVTDFAL
jgi:hypothetical protein